MHHLLGRLWGGSGVLFRSGGEKSFSFSMLRILNTPRVDPKVGSKV